MQGPDLSSALQMQLRISRTDRDLSRLATHMGVGEDELLEWLLLDMHERGSSSREALARLQTRLEAERRRPQLKIVTN
jgi:hypothetical protein